MGDQKIPWINKEMKKIAYKKAIYSDFKTNKESHWL